MTKKDRGEVLNELWPIYEKIGEFYGSYLDGARDKKTLRELDPSNDMAELTAMFNGVFGRLKLPLDK